LGELQKLYKKVGMCVCLILIYCLKTRSPATTGHRHASSVFTNNGVCGRKLNSCLCRQLFFFQWSQPTSRRGKPVCFYCWSLGTSRKCAVYVWHNSVNRNILLLHHSHD